MLEFIPGGIYHVYNAGCGEQTVFFQSRNYHYFIKKIKTHISPYADVLHYELKTNAIKLLIYVKKTKLFIPERNRIRSLAESIGIMLRSYAQAINKQEKRKGVLWQGPTQAALEGFYPLAEAEKEQVKSITATSRDKTKDPAKVLAQDWKAPLSTRTDQSIYTAKPVKGWKKCLLYPILIYFELSPFSIKVFRMPKRPWKARRSNNSS